MWDAVRVSFASLQANSELALLSFAFDDWKLKLENETNPVDSWLLFNAAWSTFLFPSSVRPVVHRGEETLSQQFTQFIDLHGGATLFRQPFI